MSFFIQKSDDTVLNKVSDPEMLRKAAPDIYGPRLEAVAEMRALDDGTLHKGNEFRRVASLINVPLLTMMKLMEPDFLKDKRKFYRWLDTGNNYQYCSYDRRKSQLPKQLTFVDGKAVL